MWDWLHKKNVQMPHSHRNNVSGIYAGSDVLTIPIYGKAKDTYFEKLPS